MYVLNRLLLLYTLFLLTACMTPNLTENYVKTTSYNLNIEHIFIPPSNEYHPFSLLHYSKKSGYTVLCSASTLSDFSEEELSLVPHHT